MKTKAQKWGNSLALRLPSHIAREAGVQPEDELDAKVVQGKIVLTPARGKPPSYNLADLVRKINPKNRYRETGFGKPRGREVW
jgi:antitoxin MazE